MSTTFSDLALAAYCPRKLFHRRRRDDRSIPDDVAAVRSLARQYPEALAAGGSGPLDEAPIAVPPDTWRARLADARDRLAVWDELADPSAESVFLEGPAARGYAHKIVESRPAPVHVSAGEPPSNGVYRSQSVRIVAAAEALEWERSTAVGAGYVEYPAYGVIREIRLTPQRRRDYRGVLRSVESMDGPPPGTESAAKCRACEFRGRCTDAKHARSPSIG